MNLIEKLIIYLSSFNYLAPKNRFTKTILRSLNNPEWKYSYSLHGLMCDVCVYVCEYFKEKNCMRARESERVNHRERLSIEEWFRWNAKEGHYQQKVFFSLDIGKTSIKHIFAISKCSQLRKILTLHISKFVYFKWELQEKG